MPITYSNISFLFEFAKHFYSVIMGSLQIGESEKGRAKKMLRIAANTSFAKQEER
jgi:hypothetical protein